MFKSAGLDASSPAIVKQLWNCDETAFSTSASASKSLAHRNAKTVNEVGGGSGRECIAVHCIWGTTASVHFIQRKKLYLRWTEGGPAGVLYGVSESGWMNASNYLSWFRNLFRRAVAHLVETTPVQMVTIHTSVWT